MPELDFKIESAQPLPYAASPQIAFKLQLTQKPAPKQPPVPIQSVTLRCQIRLEPARRRYSPTEQDKLFDLFGEPQRWGQTVRSTLWINTSIIVPPFTDQTTVDLPVPCTFDFNVANAKYFNALEQGDVPLCFLFSGSIFYAGENGALQVEQISWEKETDFRLPVSVWKQMMDMYYPNSAWLCLHKDVFDALQQFKSRQHLVSFEAAIEKLLADHESKVD